jgi:hypothetical protein
MEVRVLAKRRSQPFMTEASTNAHHDREASFERDPRILGTPGLLQQLSENEL